MGHVTQDVSRIAHNLVRGLAFDMADEADATHGEELWWRGEPKVKAIKSSTHNDLI